MTIATYPVFYFGTEVTELNQNMPFEESAVEYNAVLNVGKYALSDFIVEVERALKEAGNLDYSVSVNRNNRRITISAPSNFSLLASTGATVGNSVYSIAGFSAVDLTGANTYTGDLGAGFEYNPQFLPQDYVDFLDWQEANEASVNESANGVVEVVSFGSLKKMQMNLTYVNNYPQKPDGPIRNNPTGLEDLRSFLLYATSKGDLEFMEDEDSRSTFRKILLDKTPSFSDGTGFKLRELYTRGAAGYFETGTLEFREIIE